MLAGKKALLFSIIMATVCMILVISCSLAWFTTRGSSTAGLSDIVSGEVTNISLGTITTAEEQIPYEGQTGLAFYDYILDDRMNTIEGYMIEEIPFTFTATLLADIATVNPETEAPWTVFRVNDSDPELSYYTNILFTTGYYLVRDDREDDKYIIYESTDKQTVLFRSTIATIIVDETTGSVSVTATYNVNRIAWSNSETEQSMRCYLANGDYLTCNVLPYNADNMGIIQENPSLPGTYMCNNDHKIYYSDDSGATVSIASQAKVEAGTNLYIVEVSEMYSESGRLRFVFVGASANATMTFDIASAIELRTRDFNVDITQVMYFSTENVSAIDDNTLRTYTSSDGSVVIENLTDPSNVTYTVRGSDNAQLYPTATTAPVASSDPDPEFSLPMDCVTTVNREATAITITPYNSNYRTSFSITTTTQKVSVLHLAATAVANVSVASTTVDDYNLYEISTEVVPSNKSAYLMIAKNGTSPNMIAKVSKAGTLYTLISTYYRVNTNCSSLVYLNGDAVLTITQSSSSTQNYSFESESVTTLRTINGENRERLVVNMNDENNYVYTFTDSAGSVAVFPNAEKPYDSLKIVATASLPIIKVKTIRSILEYTGVDKQISDQNETTITNLQNTEQEGVTTTNITYDLYVPSIHGTWEYSPITATTDRGITIYYSENAGVTRSEATYDQIIAGTDLYVANISRYSSATHGELVNKTNKDYDILYSNDFLENTSSANISQIVSGLSPFYMYNAETYGALPTQFITESGFVFYHRIEADDTPTIATLAEINTGSNLFVIVGGICLPYFSALYGRLYVKTLDNYPLYHGASVNGAMKYTLATAGELLAGTDIYVKDNTLFIKETQSYKSIQHGAFNNCYTNLGLLLYYSGDSGVTLNPASLTQVARGNNLYVMIEDPETHEIVNTVYKEENHGLFNAVTATGNKVYYVLDNEIRTSKGHLIKYGNTDVNATLFQVVAGENLYVYLIDSDTTVPYDPTVHGSLTASAAQTAYGVNLYCVVYSDYDQVTHGAYAALTSSGLTVYYSTNEGITRSVATPQQLLAGGNNLIVARYIAYNGAAHGESYMIYYCEIPTATHPVYTVANSVQLREGLKLYVIGSYNNSEPVYVPYNSATHGSIMINPYTLFENRFYVGNNYNYSYASQTQINSVLLNPEGTDFELYIENISIRDRRLTERESSTKLDVEMVFRTGTITAYAIYNDSVLDTAYHGVKTFAVNLNVLSGEVYSLCIIPNNLILTPSYKISELETMVQRNEITKGPVYHTYVTVTKTGSDTINKRHFGLSMTTPEGHGEQGLFWEDFSVSNYDQTTTSVRRNYLSYNATTFETYGYIDRYFVSSGVMFYGDDPETATAATLAQISAGESLYVKRATSDGFSYNSYISDIHGAIYSSFSTSKGYSLYYSGDGGTTLILATMEQIHTGTNIYVIVDVIRNTTAEYNPEEHGTFVCTTSQNLVVYNYDNLGLNSSNTYSIATCEQLWDKFHDGVDRNLFIRGRTDVTVYDKHMDSYGNPKILYQAGEVTNNGIVTNTSISFQEGSAFYMNNFTFISDFYWEMDMRNDATGEVITYYPDSEGYASLVVSSTNPLDRFTMAEEGAHDYTCTMRLYFVSPYTYTHLSDESKVIYKYNSKRNRYEMVDSGDLMEFAYSDIRFMGTNFIISLALGINVDSTIA